MKYWISTLLLVFTAHTFAASEDETASFEKLEVEYETLLAQESVNSIHRRITFEEKQLAYDLESLQHRRASFSFQLIQGWVIFIVVMVLVLGGFVLAFMQFKLDEKVTLAKLKLPESNGEAKKTDGEKTSSAGQNGTKETTFEFSAKGVKISSSVIGLIVLAMSFAFFYMYITHVYTITELGNATSSANSTPAP